MTPAGGGIPALQKAAFFALRLAHLRRTGQYVAARRELLPLLEPEERELLGDGCTLPALMAWPRGRWPGKGRAGRGRMLSIPALFFLL